MTLESPNYQRLKAIAELQSSSNDIDDLKSVQKSLQEIQNLLTSIKEQSGLSGKTAWALQRRLGVDKKGIERHSYSVDKLISNHEAIDKATAHLQLCYNSNISSQLVSETEKASHSSDNPAHETTLKPQSLAEIAQQRNVEREAKSLEIVQEWEKQIKQVSGHKVNRLYDSKEPPAENPHNHGGGGGSRGGGGGGGAPGGYGGGGGAGGSGYGLAADGTGFGRPDLTTTGSASDYPTGAEHAFGRVDPSYHPTAEDVVGKADRTPFGPDGGAGTGRLDPHPPSPEVRGLMDHDPTSPGKEFRGRGGAKITPDGAVTGYLPTGGVGSAGGLGGGSAFGLPDYNSPGITGAGGETRPSGAVSGVLGGGAVGGSAASGSGAGAGAGTAQPVGGMIPPMGAAGAAAGGRGAGASPGARPGIAGMPGMHGAGASDKDKKGRSLVGYQVVRLNDDPDSQALDPSLYGAGDADSLKPLSDEESESDRW